MRQMIRLCLFLALLLIVSIACNVPAQAGTRTQATLDAEATAIPATLAANATDAPATDAPATDAPASEPTSQAQETVPAAPTLTETLMYYAFTSAPIEGSIVIVPDVLILIPYITDEPRGPIRAGNVQDSLNAMFADPNNPWTGTDLSAGDIGIDNGHATVTLNGTITGAGDAVLSAARWQILLTIFAEPSIDSAVVTLNGENIGNLGISHSSEAKPADYAYTRAEIEAFRAENTYAAP